MRISPRKIVEGPKFELTIKQSKDNKLTIPSLRTEGYAFS